MVVSLVSWLKLGNLLFAFYLLIPLLLKLLLVAFALRRVKLMSQQDLQKVAEKEDTDVSVSEAFEVADDVADPVRSFMVIEGPQPLVVQFFRHYGHTISDQNSLWVGDRVREVT